MRAVAAGVRVVPETLRKRISSGANDEHRAGYPPSSSGGAAVSRIRVFCFCFRHMGDLAILLRCGQYTRIHIIYVHHTATACHYIIIISCYCRTGNFIRRNRRKNSTHARAEINNRVRVFFSLTDVVLARSRRTTTTCI